MAEKTIALRWHHVEADEWRAGYELPYDTNPNKLKYRHFADVGHASYKGGPNGESAFALIARSNELFWFKTVDDAKLHVDALFALEL